MGRSGMVANHYGFYWEVIQMSVSIRIRAGDKKPFSVNIDALPQRVEVNKSRKGSAVILPMLIIPLLFLFFVLSSVLDLIIALPVVVLLGIVAGLLAWRAIARKGQSDIMDFAQDGVEVVEAGILRDRIWKARYDEFEGVLLREKGSRAKGSANVTYQIIELKHGDPQKILPLYVRQGGEAPTERWQAYARLFSLPALEE